MITNLLLATAALGTTGPATRTWGDAYRPHVEVWTNHGEDPYRTGQGVRVFLRADRDAYVTVFRVDTDGRVRVLFPHEPWEDNFVRSDREFEIDGGYASDAFDIDDYPGVGYLFAVASADPFTYDPIASRDHWDYGAIADGRVRGDPYVALTDLANRIVPSENDDWDYDMTPYYVQQHYDYPRFLCYDCHTYASWTAWDPYAYSCVRFRIVVYDDPYYYPYRYYGGTRVVFTRPLRPEPRFIFKDRDGVGDDRFVIRERQRPLNDNGRRGVRGVDIGQRGTVPIPDLRGRRRGDQPQNDASGRRDDGWLHRLDGNRSDQRTDNGRRDQGDQRDQSRRDQGNQGDQRDQSRRDKGNQGDQRDQPRRDQGDQGDQRGLWGIVPRRDQGQDHPTEPDRNRQADPDRNRQAQPDRNRQGDRPQPDADRPPPRDRAVQPRNDPPQNRGGDNRGQTRTEPRRDAPKSDGKAKGQPDLRRRRP